MSMNPEQVQSLAAYLTQVLEREYGTTKKVLAALPDNKHEWRPHEKGRTAGELAWHIATADVFFLESIAKGSFTSGNPGQPPKTTAEIISFYEQKFPPALSKVKALSAGQLAQTVDFRGIFNHPAFVYLTVCANHGIHHRGQLSAYLRAMGERVPSIYGPSADEAIEVKQAASR